MGDPNYPEDIRDFDHKPGSPFYNDPTEGVEFENEKERQFNERMDDASWVREGLSEHEDPRYLEIGEVMKMAPGEAKSLRLGDLVEAMIDEYAQPTDEDVLESLNTEPGEK